MNAHTPGPWTTKPPCREEQQYWWTIRAPGTKPQVVSFEVARLSSANTPELEHDAQLIAAAPDLLEALKLCAAVCAGETSYKRGLVEALEAARAALAKAEGAKS